ncbi:unnamed protein product, partial [Brenthis ino]
MAGGRRGSGAGPAAGGPAGARGARGSLSIRARATLYLSSHRSPFAGPTKKEIGFADFDPFVFGQRPAMRAGAEKCEGALIGRAGPAPRTQPPSSLGEQSRAQFKGGCGVARRPVWSSVIYNLIILPQADYGMDAYVFANHSGKFFHDQRADTTVYKS